MKNFSQSINEKRIIAVVGAGGKTSLIHKLTEVFLSQGKKVLVTTSAHMYIEEDTLLTDDADEIIGKLQQNGYAMAGIQDGEKIKALSKETYEIVCEHADIVLVEADGSKHLPLKFPNENEPVVYENVTDVIVVWGKHALGKKAGEVCHRLELAKGKIGISEDTIITEEIVERLIEKGYLEPMKNMHPHLHLYVHCYIMSESEKSRLVCLANGEWRSETQFMT